MRLADNNSCPGIRRDGRRGNEQAQFQEKSHVCKGQLHQEGTASKAHIAQNPGAAAVLHILKLN